MSEPKAPKSPEQETPKAEQIAPKSKQATTKNTSFKLGRPSKYTPRFCKSIIDYFTQDLYYNRVKSQITQKNGSIVKNYEQVPNPPKFLSDFAYSIGVDVKTLNNWSKQFPDFFLAFMRVKQMSQNHIVALANMGLYNSNFAQFTMTNISDWRFKKDIELSGKVDAQVFFESMLINSADALANERAVLSNLN